MRLITDGAVPYECEGAIEIRLQNFQDFFLERRLWKNFEYPKIFEYPKFPSTQPKKIEITRPDSKKCSRCTLIDIDYWKIRINNSRCMLIFFFFFFIQLRFNTSSKLWPKKWVTCLEPTGQIAERVQNLSIYTIYVDIFLFCSVLICTLSAIWPVDLMKDTQKNDLQVANLQQQ